MNATWKKAVVTECDDIVEVGGTACSRSPLPGAGKVTERVVFWRGALGVS